jgi:hypothetical protein
MLPTDDEEGARDPYYTCTSAATSDIPRLVVKCDEAFFVADHHGDFPELPESEFGFYVGGTRFLRSLELAVHGQRPLNLNAAVSDDGRQVAVDLTNSDLCHGEIIVLKGRLVRLARRLVLAPAGLTEILSVESFSPEPHETCVGDSMRSASTARAAGCRGRSRHELLLLRVRRVDFQQLYGDRRRGRHRSAH